MWRFSPARPPETSSTNSTFRTTCCPRVRTSPFSPPPSPSTTRSRTGRKSSPRPRPTSEYCRSARKGPRHPACPRFHPRDAFAAPAAKASRGWKRGQAGCRGPLRALRQYSDVGLGRGEDFLPVLDLVVDGLGGGEKGLVRTLGQQVVRKVELVEDVSGGRAGLNLHIADLAAAGHND